ncbi:spore germination protein, partial [Heliobacterium chlorum]
EDIYFRWPFGSFARLLRILSLLTTMFLPAIYLSMSNFHPEMLPTEFMLSLAAARERVPFPAIVTIIFLEIAFEFIRESSLRVPRIIGPTIGIVGAIIIGQAVVQANIVSPVMIIVMAVTVLAGFTMPQYVLFYSLRLVRLFVISLAAIFGFYGVL